MSEQDRVTLAEALEGAEIVHLQPDDVIVFALGKDVPLTFEMASRVRKVLGDRRIVVLAKGVQFGIDRDGNVTRPTAEPATRPDGR